MPVPKRQSVSNASCFAPYFLGQDPTRVERLAAVLRDAEILGPPMYFMEIPLWDIIGKQANLPAYKLWGAASDRVPAYCATAEIRLAGTASARRRTHRGGGLSGDEAALPQ